MSTPLLGPREKAELEVLIRAQIESHYQAHGPASLLAPGLHVVVRADGVTLEPSARTDSLAQVEIRTLFTALCYLAGDSTDAAMTRDALDSLATEATSATAALINKLS